MVDLMLDLNERFRVLFEDAQKSGKEDAVDVLLDLSMNMSVQLKVLLMVYLITHTFEGALQVKIEFYLKMHMQCTCQRRRVF